MLPMSNANVTIKGKKVYVDGALDGRFGADARREADRRSAKTRAARGGRRAAACGEVRRKP